MSQYPEVFCKECKKSCEPQLVDFGIGPYEFWGQRCVDTNKQWVSSCCEASLFLDSELTLEYIHEDWQPDPPEREREYDSLYD